MSIADGALAASPGGCLVDQWGLLAYDMIYYPNPQSGADADDHAHRELDEAMFLNPLKTSEFLTCNPNRNNHPRRLRGWLLRHT